MSHHHDPNLIYHCIQNADVDGAVRCPNHIEADHSLPPCERLCKEHAPKDDKKAGK